MILKRKQLFSGKNIGSALTKILSLLIICLLFTVFSQQAYSTQRRGHSSYSKVHRTHHRRHYRYRRRHRRVYHPAKTRAKAINMIRTHSEAICKLAGLEPIIGDSTYLDDDSQDSEDVEAIEANDYAEQGDAAQSGDDDSIGDPADTAIDIQTFRMLWLSYVDEGKENEITPGGINKKSLMGAIMNWLGTPYRFGGTTRRSIDCSAFVQKVFREACGLELPRTARTQVRLGAKVRKSNLRFGDLIFFHTYTYRFASHVGIYLGNGLFAHASSSYGVTVSRLAAHYYTHHYYCARRLYLDGLEQYVSKTDNERSPE